MTTGEVKSLHLYEAKPRSEHLLLTKTVVLGLILSRVEPKTIKLVSTASLLDVKHQKKDNLNRLWQFHPKTERPFRCLVTKTTW